MRARQRVARVHLRQSIYVLVGVGVGRRRQRDGRVERDCGGGGSGWSVPVRARLAWSTLPVAHHRHLRGIAIS